MTAHERYSRKIRTLSTYALLQGLNARAPTITTCSPPKRLHTFLTTPEQNHDDVRWVPARLEVKGTKVEEAGHRRQTGWGPENGEGR